MKDLDVQKRSCGVGFEPVLDTPRRVYVAVDYARPFQLLELDEVLELDRNLHDAFKVAWLAARARGLPTPAAPARAGQAVRS
jgi:hypothetical protein